MGKLLFEQETYAIIGAACNKIVNNLEEWKDVVLSTDFEQKK